MNYFAITFAVNAHSPKLILIIADEILMTLPPSLIQVRLESGGFFHRART